MITVDGLTVEFGGTTLFKDISFQINEKDRIALMGKNGAGKSTLLEDHSRRPHGHAWIHHRSEGLRHCLPASAPDDGRWTHRV